MAHNNSPSSVMYAELKALGINNRDAATILLDVDTKFGTGKLRARIESRSQLSRSIVHVPPGELDASLFRDYSKSVPRIVHRVLDGLEKRRSEDAVAFIVDTFSGSAAEAMQKALIAYGIDSSAYRNALFRISQLEEVEIADKAELYVMLFVVTGCTGDPSEAAHAVTRATIETFKTDFKTPKVTVDMQGIGARKPGKRLALARILDNGLIFTGSMHPLATGGSKTIIGAFAKGENVISDVGEDVSRRHAAIYEKDGHWYVIGLGSLNGTAVIGGSDKLVHIVEPPREARPHGFAPKPYEVLPTDIICFGATTRFMALPIPD